MSYNKLTSISFSFKELRRLGKLDLEGNNLECLFNKSDAVLIDRSDAPLWPYLTSVNLKNNHFKELPNYLGRC